jgi:hypothetical protein
VRYLPESWEKRDSAVRGRQLMRVNIDITRARAPRWQWSMADLVPA